MSDSLDPTPSFRIEDQARSKLQNDLVRLEIEETTAGLRTLMACFLAVSLDDSEEPLYLDGKAFDFGQSLEVQIHNQRVFKGIITAIEAEFPETGEELVTVRAEDALMRLRMTSRCKTYHQVTDADLARAIALEYGLVADAAADGPTYDLVQQWNLSDLAFLRERGRRIGAELYFADDKLHFKTRDQRAEKTVKLAVGRNLLSLQVRGDLAHQRSVVHVGGYDATTREGIDEEAGADVVQAEAPGGFIGPAMVHNAPGLLLRQSPHNSAEAKALAKAEMLRRGRAFVTAWGVAVGIPELGVGCQVSLQGVGAPFTGDGYYVTRACHTFDLSNGYRTSFEAERATLNK